jgi:hypothetical protein
MEGGNLLVEIGALIISGLQEENFMAFMGQIGGQGAPAGA